MLRDLKKYNKNVNLTVKLDRVLLSILKKQKEEKMIFVKKEK